MGLGFETCFVKLATGVFAPQEVLFAALTPLGPHFVRYSATPRSCSRGRGFVPFCWHGYGPYVGKALPRATINYSLLIINCLLLSPEHGRE